MLNCMLLFTLSIVGGMKVVETAKLVEASDCWLQTVVMDDQAENSRKFEDRHVPAASPSVPDPLPPKPALPP